MINLLNTIHKLKAGLSAVIGDDKCLLEKTKDHYISQTMIHRDENTKHKHCKFDAFL